MHFDDKKPFINWTYNPDINYERARIIEDMMRFIQTGLRDRGGQTKARSDFSVFENWVKAGLYERLQSPMAKPLSKRHLAPHGDTLQLVAECFLKEHEWVTHSAPIAAFYAGPISEEVKQRLNAFSHPQVDEEAPTVATAFEVTYSNVARASTRLTLLHVIPTLLQLKGALPEWATLREHLWLQMSGFQRDLLMFGGLAGGELLKTAVRLVAKQTCYNHSPDSHIKFGLMHYISVDGQSPGRWMTATEDSLDNDIRRKYEAL